MQVADLVAAIPRPKPGLERLKERVRAATEQKALVLIYGTRVWWMKIPFKEVYAALGMDGLHYRSSFPVALFLFVGSWIMSLLMYFGLGTPVWYTILVPLAAGGAGILWGRSRNLPLYLLRSWWDVEAGQRMYEPMYYEDCGIAMTEEDKQRFAAAVMQGEEVLARAGIKLPAIDVENLPYNAVFTTTHLHQFIKMKDVRSRLSGGQTLLQKLEKLAVPGGAIALIILAGVFWLVLHQSSPATNATTQSGGSAANEQPLQQRPR